MGSVNLIVTVYGLLSIALGAFGYFEKESVVSLIAGGIAGLLLLGTVALHKFQPRIARIAAAVITLAMLGQMGRTAMKDPKWHTVTMAVASLIVLIVLVSGHFSSMSKRNSEV
jgi:uncharacterized membrane protein (UPF0136 family)